MKDYQLKSSTNFEGVILTFGKKRHPFPFLKKMYEIYQL